MAERLCGYCRQLGHRKPDCPDFKAHRDLVLYHTPKQRKLLIEGFAKVGMGIGALLRVQDYWNQDKYRLCMVKDFEWVSNCSFIEVRNIKYSKRVRLETKSVESGFINRSVHAGVVSFDGGAEEMSVSVPISRILMRHQDPNSVAPERDFYNRINFIIEVPSNDIQYDPEVLVRQVQMPQRLLLGGEDKFNTYVRGIMP
jgi:hypothetical protein